ncbi:hypothetical protein FO440_18430 [Mucilaginibacter corticis]|uniref:UDP-N-acetylglucosamine kinase n=1 Tax=Mucilaginibacter corticis TaxID=2597670 RepID=A0A556MIR7_9SPHI|nr:hypothetical protein [Mucilaginibacter corticis]TSJ39715.1 hypothetical protein FO440_18430 [Mucilaginibacter corticis]
MNRPELIMVAGCNAAGKSSFIRSRMAQLEDFIMIMTDVSKSSTKTDVRESIAAKKSIILETVFNDASFKDLIDEARDAGYATSLIALFLDSPTQSYKRVAARIIDQAGLVISAGNIKLNFNESFKNIALYYFYFDRSDFVYTGTAGENLLVMEFDKSTLRSYKPSDLTYPIKFAEFAHANQRLNDETRNIILKNESWVREYTPQENPRLQD